MDKKLVKYVSENLHKGYSMADIAARLRKEGWEERDIQDSLTSVAKQHQHNAALGIAVAGFAAFIVLGLLVYFVILSPSFVKEPVIEKPAMIESSQQVYANGNAYAEQEFEATAEQLPEPEQMSTASAVQENDSKKKVNPDQIEYVLTKLGAYKLHENTFTGDKPELEIELVDIGKVFSAVVEDNEVIVSEGHARTPDAKIRADSYAVSSLVSAGDDEFKEKAAQLLNEREQRGYTGELVAGKGDLLLKGYLGLYDDMKAMFAPESPTGQVVSDLSLIGSELIGMFFLIAVLWAALILRMAVRGA
jgi:hypothetical protein